MEAILKSIASSALAYTAHYGATKFYNYACMPDGFYGFLSGLVTTGSPVCQAGVQIISNTQTSYSSLILTGITHVLVEFLSPKGLS